MLIGNYCHKKSVNPVRSLTDSYSYSKNLSLQTTSSSVLHYCMCSPQPPPRSVVPSSITYNWARCKNKPEGMEVCTQPVTMNGKLYMYGYGNGTHTVLVYTPDQEHWDVLPPPPVEYFTVATLRGRLLVVGGVDKSTDKTTNTILTFDESSRQWLQSLPPIPVAVTCPAVVEYQDHLIVAGGQGSNARATDVNILDTTTNKWTAAEPLPNTDRYNTCLIGDTLYIVGSATKQVFRADVPSLISRASSGVWETVASVPLYRSSPVTFGNTLLTVGGSDESVFGSTRKTGIHLYDPTKDQWTKCGDLPEPMECHCTVLSDKLYVIGSSSVYMSTLSITH